MNMKVAGMTNADEKEDKTAETAVALTEPDPLASTTTSIALLDETKLLVVAKDEIIARLQQKLRLLTEVQDDTAHVSREREQMATEDLLESMRVRRQLSVAHDRISQLSLELDATRESLDSLCDPSNKSVALDVEGERGIQEVPGTPGADSDG